jgi:hypothetical protein
MGVLDINKGGLCGKATGSDITEFIVAALRINSPTRYDPGWQLYAAVQSGFRD